MFQHMASCTIDPVIPSRSADSTTESLTTCCLFTEAFDYGKQTAAAEDNSITRRRSQLGLRKMFLD